ncbi:hypothetical protein K493DRAFT_389862 [Basidiobolus meristosporus CBS 931.73]|uniref:Uncharacterized protein n=1 Tax=Basidiobolus meristosporus CBS 931.73 TaxID=1314790 RepID=A0A1Y1X616_9FUNG|nr:hypothetical protein K493DRAFT_389862 [Basidiobolus meristosporus CBS 931.73]|eukprot:ORX80744.1 hypothetical protein K493DRAFT_389862 [Basidiobolus meristosporus CBS 931.73]
MCEMDEVVRTAAGSFLELLIELRYNELLGLSSDDVFQRVQLLGSSELSEEQLMEALQWNHGIQHHDLVQSGGKLDFSVPVRYKRYGANDFRAFVEVQKGSRAEGRDFGLVLKLEDSWIYHDICWRTDVEDWKASIVADQSCDCLIENCESYPVAESEETSCWSPYDEIHMVADRAESDLVPWNGGCNDGNDSRAQHISEDAGEEQEEEFIQVSAFDSAISRESIDQEHAAFSPPLIVSPVLVSNSVQQEALTQHSPPQTPIQSSRSCNITEPDLEMTSRLDLATMLTLGLSNLNITKGQQAQWRLMISQLLRTSKDMARLAGFSEAEVMELVHEVYGEITPSL